MVWWRTIHIVTTEFMRVGGWRTVIITFRFTKHCVTRCRFVSKFHACLFNGISSALSFFLFFFIIGRVGVCDLLRQMPDRIKGANFYRQSNLKHIMCYRWLAEAYSPFSPSLVQCTWVGALLLSMIVLPFRSRSKALTIFIRCLGNFEMLLVGFSINIFRFLSPEWVPSKVIKIKAMPRVYRRLRFNLIIEFVIPQLENISNTIPYKLRGLLVCDPSMGNLYLISNLRHVERTFLIHFKTMYSIFTAEKLFFAPLRSIAKSHDVDPFCSAPKLFDCK